jgi:hypothetical protein
MQIRKQVQEQAQYFNDSFQQLRMAQSCVRDLCALQVQRNSMCTRVHFI